MEFVTHLTFTEILTLATVVVIPSMIKVITYSTLLKKLEVNDKDTQENLKKVVNNLSVAVNSFTDEIGKIKIEIHTWAAKFDSMYSKHEIRLQHVEKECVSKKRKGTR